MFTVSLRLFWWNSCCRHRIKRFDKRNCQTLHGLRFLLQMECLFCGRQKFCRWKSTKRFRLFAWFRRTDWKNRLLSAARFLKQSFNWHWQNRNLESSSRSNVSTRTRFKNLQPQKFSLWRLRSWTARFNQSCWPVNGWVERFDYSFRLCRWKTQSKKSSKKIPMIAIFYISSAERSIFNKILSTLPKPSWNHCGHHPDMILNIFAMRLTICALTISI